MHAGITDRRFRGQQVAADEVVKTGDRLQVRVLEVDLQRRRIALSAKRGDGPRAPMRPRDAAPPRDRSAAPGEAPTATKGQRKFGNNPFADLLKGKPRG